MYGQRQVTNGMRELEFLLTWELELLNEWIKTDDGIYKKRASFVGHSAMKLADSLGIDLTDFRKEVFDE